MSLSIFNYLSLGPLQSTNVVIHFANRSVAYPTGFIEDMLVRVGELIFPIDFYVLNMEEGFSHGSVPIILGRPFMKIVRTKIDVYAGTLSMEFGDIVVHFNILDAMKHPSEDHPVFRDEIIDQILMIICLILILFFMVGNIHFYLIRILVIPYALNLNLSLNLIMCLTFMLRVNLNLSLVLYLLRSIF